MTYRRSILPLLCVLGALLGLPASALAQDVTAPVNTTPATPAAWQTAPYLVALSGTDSESGLANMEWNLDSTGPTAAADGELVTVSASGIHSFETRAIDVDGNMSLWRVETLKIDRDLPSDGTDSGTTAWRPAPTSVLIFASDVTSGVDHMEWQLDGGSVHSDPSGTSVPIVADGAHVLRTRAVDVAGNASSWTDHTVKVDTITPTDDTAAPAGWQTAPLQVSVTGSDAHSGVATLTWQLDGGAVNSGPPPATVTVSGDGTHTLQTRITDVAGHQSGFKAATIRIDTTAPANQTPLASSAWRATDYAVMVSGADGGSGLAQVEWRVDAGPVTAGASPLQATVSGTGTHTLETRAVDVAGNASGWRSESVRIDSVPPANTTTSPSGPVANPYTVSVTGNDAHSGINNVQWRVDGGVIQSGTVGSQVTVTGNGAHTLETQLSDLAGNASGWRTDNVTIDIALNNDTNVPIDTTQTAPAGWRTDPLTLTVSATDSGSGMDVVQWRIDGVSIQTRSGASAPVTISAEGVHDLETRGRDNSNNYSAWRLQTIRIDTTVPTDTTAVPAAWQTTPNVTLSAYDALSGIADIEYKLNGGAVQHATNGQVVSLGEGTSTIAHRVIDVAGQASQFRTDTFHVDTVLPVNTSAVPASAWRATALTLPLSGTDVGSGLATMQWRVDGGAIQTGGPAVVGTDGAHTLETRAVDTAGNPSAWRSDPVSVDTVVPVNTTPAAPAGWRTTPYSVHVAGTDVAGSGVARIERMIDGGAVDQNPDLTISTDGVHELRTRVVDVVGNASAWRIETVSIDATAPVNTSAIPATAWRSATLSLPLSGTDATSGLATMQWRLDGGAIQTGGPAVVDTDGVHTLETRALDTAGNASAWRSNQVSVDTVVPVNTTPVASAGWRTTDYTVQVAGSDGTGSGIATVESMLDGGAVSQSATVTISTDGVHELRTRVVDLAGNASAWRIETISLDKTLPVNTSAVPDSAWRPDALALAISGTDDTSGVATMQWRLDGGTVVAGGPAIVATDGVHVLETRAVDTAGNASAWRSDTVRVDTTAPINDTLQPPSGWHATPYTAQVVGSDGSGSGVDKIEWTLDGGVVSEDPDVTISTDGDHVLLSRIVDAVGNASVWRSDSVQIDSVAPVAGLACSPVTGWSNHAVTCIVNADGGPSGLASAMVSRDGGAASLESNGAAFVFSTDGAHTLHLDATDGAGNTAAANAAVHVDRTVPTATLTCAANSAAGYSCRASGTDATSGLASLSYSVNGGAWALLPAGGSFTVAKGSVRARALDVAGNQAVTPALTLADRAVVVAPPRVTSSSAPVYLAGHTNSRSLVGAMRAARSRTGTVSVDLRPLAVARGKYRVEIKLKSGRHGKTVKRSATVARGQTLPRMSASLANATAKCTVTLTVRKRVGRTWRKYATSKVVLAG